MKPWPGFATTGRGWFEFGNRCSNASLPWHSQPGSSSTTPMVCLTLHFPQSPASCFSCFLCSDPFCTVDGIYLQFSFPSIVTIKNWCALTLRSIFIELGSPSCLCFGSAHFVDTFEAFLAFVYN